MNRPFFGVLDADWVKDEVLNGEGGSNKGWTREAGTGGSRPGHPAR